MREEGKFPEWLFSFRAATPQEDREGVDVWADTDAGSLPINVKHNHRHRTEFLDRENRKHIICVVFSPEIRFGSAFNFVVSQLIQKRSKLLKQKALEES